LGHLLGGGEDAIGVAAEVADGGIELGDRDVHGRFSEGLQGLSYFTRGILARAIIQKS
jgi:hypothetical protein